MARKPKYARGEIMSGFDCDFILVKGNLTDEEFREALARQGHGELPINDGDIKHGWRRCNPARNICDDYDFLLARTEPHARGAFEATWVEW